MSHMKKLFLILFFTPLFLSGCDAIQGPAAEVSGAYVGSEHEGNYIWAGAMNLAWTDLNESILNEPLILNTEDPAVLEMVDAFNDPVFEKGDLDEASYYIKSGYGQETINQINQESREKFPEKRFTDLDYKLGAEDIIAYAYFLKQVEYLEPFQVNEMEFEGEMVNGFEVDETRNVEVVNYWNDDQFLIQLPLKNSEDELFLAKGFSMEGPEDVLKNLSEYDHSGIEMIRWNDKFEVPMISLDYRRDYSGIIGNFLANEGFENHVIAQMYEKIKFQMDESGARVENEAIIGVLAGSNGPESDSPPPPTPRNFILDEPFWMIMKRSGSDVPYFILGIQNTEFMEVVGE